MKFDRVLKACTLAAFLSGCAALPGGGPAPLDTYDLTAAFPQAEGPRRSNTQILIAEPSALKSLDSENIVIKTSPAAIEYLKGAQWADRLPRVVQARLVEAFQASGRVGGVGQPGEGLAIDYQVVTTIRSFEVRVDGTPRAEVELFVRLLNDRNGVVRASRSITQSVPVGGAGNDAYVRALDAAFAGAAAEIVAWSLSSI
ncbi:ABC-type transport auxiliary lipoprotein family protein [Aquamicrobium sp. LC103]|uniref:ABC-type transport auxiliary lipoprotein family protein n=1 Tax=Aquamicrobium sp. LC103 TaxID=1120658 RepID=UPI001FF00AD5|nr:ABC-type transport auxiliary lipoprotein family protein [Aquamicrobium sp. LC103]